LNIFTYVYVSKPVRHDTVITDVYRVCQ